jgi:hypothetical protein
VTAVVLLILAAIWAAVLLPPWYQARRLNRPGDSIASFRNQLSVLERATPGARIPATRTRPARPPASAPQVARVVALPRPQQPERRERPERPERTLPSRRDARRRRRDVFLTLLGAAGLTFVLALVIGGPVWGLHLAVDVLFGGYVAMLIRLQQQAAEREMKLRYLPTAARAGQPEPALLLRRSAN